MNKKTSLYLYILIAVFTVFVGGATYAFFAGNNNIDAKANLSAETGKTYTFTSTSATNFELNLTSADMQQSQSGNYVSSTVGTLDVSLTSPEGKNTMCTFDLLFTWTSTSKYTTPNVSLPYTSGGTTYNYEFSTLVKDGDAIAFAERDLSNVNNGAGFGTGSSGTIAENLSLSANGGTINKTYSIEARIYNLPVNQPNLIGKNMKASVKVDNLNCEYGSPTGEGTIYAMMKNSSSSDASINFGVAPTASTSGVYLRSTTSSDTYPVYYYRGIVDNNNVIFDNFCWKIVRTTENAGIKLIYNGRPAANGSCNNTGTATQLSTTNKFNNDSVLVSDVGYMYGQKYDTDVKTMSSQSGTYVYGNDVSYNNGVYTLINTKSSSSWGINSEELANGYHYTCFTSSNSCTGSVYYISYFGHSTIAYYLTLNGEANIDEVKEKMFKNENDSAIKSVIDDWYEANIKDKEDKLEDAIWCNDRRITSGALVSKDAVGTSYNYFSAYERNAKSPYIPSFSCDKNDAFTQNESSVGNGALDNRVGLLTADEYTLAGSGLSGYSTSSYLRTIEYQWTMSPYYHHTDSGLIGTHVFALSSVGNLENINVGNNYGIRPAISLKPGTKFIGAGNGSVASPYIVE